LVSAYFKVEKIAVDSDIDYWVSDLDIVGFIDAEYALDPSWASKNGVDVEKLFISQPDHGEQALEMAHDMVLEDFDMIVIDSVAALTPRAEIEGEMGDSHMGLQARLMSQAMRKITADISRKKSIVVFINQVREKIGVVYGNPEVTPGGRALKFYSSVRMEVRRSSVLKDGKDATGHTVRVKIVKNKVATPYKETELMLDFNAGFNVCWDLMNAALTKGIVTKSGSWYYFDKEQLGQGMNVAAQNLTEEQIEEIRNRILNQKEMSNEQEE